MLINKFIGVALVIVAVGLAYWGYDMSQAVTNQFVKALSGSTNDKVMYAYIGAAISGLAGAYLLLVKK